MKLYGREQTMSEFNNHDEFAERVCEGCVANDWYCPTECNFLEKARTYPIERINKAFEYCDEDMFKTCKLIQRWKGADNEAN